MSKNDASYIVSIDVGTTKVRTVVAEVNPEGQLEIIGFGEAESKGLRRGAVVNLDAAAGAIMASVQEAEMMTGLAINAANIAITGANIKGYNSRGIVAVSRRHHEISEEDKERVIEQARALSIPSDREVMAVLPQEYTVDGQDGIRDPVGMVGVRLETSIHVLTAPLTVRQNILTSVSRANITPLEVVLSPLAAAEAVLSEDEKEFGVVVVNLGGETISLAIYQNGSVRHTGVMPIGANHFTNDLAMGLRMPMPEAERLKREFGTANLASLSVEERAQQIESPTAPGRQPLPISRQLLCDILQSRAEEIMTEVYKELSHAGYARQLYSGVVLTGGGAMLAGLPEIAESVMNLPVRIGSPEGLGGLAERICRPEYTTAIGLLIIGQQQQIEEQRPQRLAQSAGAGLGSLTARLRGMFGSLF